MNMLEKLVVKNHINKELHFLRDLKQKIDMTVRERTNCISNNVIVRTRNVIVELYNFIENNKYNIYPDLFKELMSLKIKFSQNFSKTKEIQLSEINKLAEISIKIQSTIEKYENALNILGGDN